MMQVLPKIQALKMLLNSVVGYKMIGAFPNAYISTNEHLMLRLNVSL